MGDSWVALRRVFLPQSLGWHLSMHQSFPDLPEGGATSSAKPSLRLLCIYIYICKSVHINYIAQKSITMPGLSWYGCYWHDNMLVGHGQGRQLIVQGHFSFYLLGFSELPEMWDYYFVAVFANYWRHKIPTKLPYFILLHVTQFRPLTNVKW